MARTKVVHIIKRFESVTAFQAYANNGQVQPAFEDAQGSKKERSDWAGTDSYEQADNLLTYGCKELHKRLEDGGVSSTRTKLRKLAERRQYTSAVVGVCPNVPNAIAGIPTAMITCKYTQHKQRVVNVCYNAGVSGSESADELTKRASKIVSACMRIEASGIRVNLYTAILSKCNKNTLSYIIKIKNSSQPFDVLKMTYPTMHASMLRRHFFRAVEVTEGVPSCYAHGYGYAIYDVEDMKKALGTEAKKFDYVCSFRSVQDMTPEQMTQAILAGN